MGAINPSEAGSIRITVNEDHIEVGNPEEWKSAEKIYVSIVEHDGLARINTISMYDPENADYIEASVKEITDKPPFILKIAYPLKKYFQMNFNPANLETLTGTY